MRFGFDAAHEELAESVRARILKDSPHPLLTQDGQAAVSLPRASWWAGAQHELRLSGLATPAEYGGSGDFTMLAVVLRESGRALAQVPLFATAALATRALVLSDDTDRQRELLPALASGAITGTVAVSEGSTRWDLAAIETLAEPSNRSFVLYGRKTFVLDGGTADVILVAARSAAGIGLFAVAGDAVGVRCTDIIPLDPSRPFATVEFSGARAQLVGDQGSATALLDRLRDSAMVALAIEQVGSAEATLAMAVEHTSTRVQFGRPLASLQAVRHRCATMLTDLESARSAAHYAVWCITNNDDHSSVAASIAGMQCSEALVRCANSNVQLHGGRGFTMSGRPHQFLRRAKSSQHLLGTPDSERELLYRKLRLPEPDSLPPTP